MIRHRNKLLFFIVIIVVMITFGCSAPPEVNEVRDVIIRHFENRGFGVPELEIGKIENIPLGDRQYMSTKGHLVQILGISLKKADSEEGEMLTFTDALIEIHRSGDGLEWVITNVSGIPVQ